MLATVLKGEVAEKQSIFIMRSFREMRSFMTNNHELFSRLNRVELKQLETDKKFEEVFAFMSENKEVSQKIFFNGQIYDAFSLLVDIVKKADKTIVLIDNYIGVDTLNILAKKKEGVKVGIYTKKKSNLTKSDIEKFNMQYKNLTVRTLDAFHDRFLILDSSICYHIGASLKDAGKKSFAVSKIEDEKIIEDILDKVWRSR